MKIYCNEIYTENGIIDGTLEIENGKFKQLTYQKTDDSIDYTGYRILPGIIDIHTHGYKGCNAQSLDKAELRRMAQALAEHGVTAFIPTCGEHFADEMTNLSLLADVIDEQSDGAKMLGIHMEGPFLNCDKRGSFQLSQLLPCSVQKVKEYIEASKNHIIYWSVAPELENAEELIQYLCSQEIVVAGGHTNASYAEYKKGIDCGIKVSTHTGNGMSQMDRKDAGAVGAALFNDIYSEVICDLHHLSLEMLEIMFKIKNNLNKMIMISDSGMLSGNEPGVYYKYGQKRIVTEKGTILLEDGSIAGSNHSLLYGIKNLETKLNKKMEDIILMSSLNPARLFKIDDKKGSIRENKDADFLIIDQDYQVVCTFVEGKCVYKK